MLYGSSKGGVVGLLALALLLLSSCGPSKTKRWSGVLKESATVVGRRWHSASSSESLDEWAFILDGRVRSVVHTVPERYEVSFSCQHGGFTVDRRELYDSLEEGQEVIVEYRELAEVTFHEDGTQSVEVVDLDFLRAVPVP